MNKDLIITIIINSSIFSIISLSSEIMEDNGLPRAEDDAPTSSLQTLTGNCNLGNGHVAMDINDNKPR